MNSILPVHFGANVSFDRTPAAPAPAPGNLPLAQDTFTPGTRPAVQFGMLMTIPDDEIRKTDQALTKLIESYSADFSPADPLDAPRVIDAEEALKTLPELTQDERGGFPQPQPLDKEALAANNPVYIKAGKNVYAFIGDSADCFSLARLNDKTRLAVSTRMDYQNMAEVAPQRTQWVIGLDGTVGPSPYGGSYSPDDGKTWVEMKVPSRYETLTDTVVENARTLFENVSAAAFAQGEAL